VSKSKEIDRLLAEESAEWTERLKHGDRHTRAALRSFSALIITRNVSVQISLRTL